MALRACEECTFGSRHASPFVQTFEVDMLQGQLLFKQSCFEGRAHADGAFAETRTDEAAKFVLRLCAIEAYSALFLFGHVMMKERCLFVYNPPFE